MPDQPDRRVLLVDQDGNVIATGTEVGKVRVHDGTEVLSVQVHEQPITSYGLALLGRAHPSYPDAAATDDAVLVVTDLRGRIRLGPSGENIGIVDFAASSPTVYNVTLTNADTEYSQALPSNCRAFEFQCRTGFDVRYAYETGKVAGPTAPYMTLKAQDVKYIQILNQGASPSTLYFASAQAGVVVELEVWT